MIKHGRSATEIENARLRGNEIGDGPVPPRVVAAVQHNHQEFVQEGALIERRRGQSSPPHRGSELWRKRIVRERFHRQRSLSKSEGGGSPAGRRVPHIHQESLEMSSGSHLGEETPPSERTILPPQPGNPAATRADRE